MADFTSVRVGELPVATFSPTDLIPHEVGGLLKSGTLQNMATAISLIIGATAGVGFRSVQMIDGGTLPTTTVQEFILVGKGTYYNVGGGATIVANEGLNVLVSNGSSWSVGVSIPIITPDIIVKKYNQLILLTTSPQTYTLPNNVEVQILHLNGGFIYPSNWVQVGNLLTITYPNFSANGLDEIIIGGLIQTTVNLTPTTDILLNQIIMLKVATSFISSNFNITGLGLGVYAKYAICNGQNGTSDMGGRTPIGYDPILYPTLGAVLGSKDAVLVEHSHITKYGQAGVGTLYPEQTYVSNTIGGNSQVTNTVGVSGIDKNIQPSIVSLFIQKITA